MLPCSGRALCEDGRSESIHRSPTAVERSTSVSFGGLRSKGQLPVALRVRAVRSCASGVRTLFANRASICPQTQLPHNRLFKSRLFFLRASMSSHQKSRSLCTKLQDLALIVPTNLLYTYAQTSIPMSMPMRMPFRNPHLSVCRSICVSLCLVCRAFRYSVQSGFL
ncbi:hypothetical protein BCV70DRAFT_123392 [Testicularia cyperi]|uniref:Uncharacterized protein n=1 Tax=Testicularia cyperi TaxID=1882483 RepID=A0A317XL84_9BASI|nr:hypothetical protein BCV70DRAFT_123392 [Testicularia cyperi]